MNTRYSHDAWNPGKSYFVLEEDTHRLLFFTLVGGKKTLEIVKFSFFPNRKGFKKWRHNVRILK